jgi:hypothetical protein
MYIALDIKDEVLAEMKRLAGDERMLSFRINQALRFYLAHLEEAEAERKAEIRALEGSLAGEEGRQLAERVAAVRNEPWR